jgi:long-chain acyl-CoA synthetase
MLVHEFLENATDRHPDRPAVWYKDEWLPFFEIEARSNRSARALAGLGVRRGQRVALLYENSFDYVVNYYAILKAGGVTVALNTDQTEDSLTYYLNHSESVALIVQEKYLPLLQKIGRNLRFLSRIVSGRGSFTPDGWGEAVRYLSFAEIAGSFPATNPGLRQIDVDLASIIYTSGSTGDPKGVMLSHLNIVQNTTSIVEYLKLTKDDRIMVVLPFYYVYGKSLLNTHFFVGGSVVIDNRFAFPKVILDTMVKTGVTGFSGVPSTFSILLNKTKVREYRFDTLRYLTQAGGAMAPAVQKDVADAFPTAELFVMYGATEAGARLSYLDPVDLPRKWGSIGKAIPNVDLFVADPVGNPMKTGETGEIVARGSNMMPGYWKDAEGTRSALHDGLYWTGDLGRMDEEGFLFVVGRSKDMIKVGGERVSAKEIEERMLEHPDIQEVAVIGVPDLLLGEAVKAYIVPKEGRRIEAEDLRKHLMTRLQSMKVPKFYEFRPALPKNESGKIMKAELRKENPM